MKIEKDVILAIIVGVIVGCLSAFFVFFLPRFFPEKTPKIEKEELVSQEETVLSPAPPYSFTIKAPEEETIFLEDKITISGKTSPGALVAIVSPVDEEVTETDNEGGFEAEISLEEGLNEINVTSYGKGGEEETKILTVYYTQEEI